MQHKLIRSLLSAAMAVAMPMTANALPTEPAQGTISLDSQEVSFSGTGGVPNVSPTAGDPVCTSNSVECDVFMLNLSLPDDYEDTQANDTIRVHVDWELADADFDIYAVEDGEVIGSAASADKPEVFEFAAGSGERSIEIQIVPFAAPAEPYTGTASLVVRAPVAPLRAGGGDTRVVVAAIDSGINPYHAYFRADGSLYNGAQPSAVSQNVLNEFNIGPDCVITLTRTGDFAADYQADLDKGTWDRAASCDVVWFTGTNILAKSSSPGTRPYMPDDEDDTHGVGVSASVLTANPDGVLLFLEGVGAASESFAMNHPSVDIITTSYGAPGSLPLPGHIEQSYTGTYLNGKLHFGACDNSPALAQADGTCGPWWSVGVAGFEEAQDNEEAPSSGGRQSVSGTAPDFIADFTQTLPYCAECEDGLDQGVGGTSFATPRSAGTFSKILLDARFAAGHTGPIDLNTAEPTMVHGSMGGAPFLLTNWQMRRALEMAAWIPSFADFDPNAALFEFGPGLPINDAAPWAQVSWGVISPQTEKGVIELALRALGVADGEVPEKTGGYCEFNNGNIDARKAYWDTSNAGSETFLNAPDPDPYLYCGDEITQQSSAGSGAGQSGGTSSPAAGGTSPAPTGGGGGGALGTLMLSLLMLGGLRRRVRRS